jgi:hypothetical protein
MFRFQPPCGDSRMVGNPYLTGIMEGLPVIQAQSRRGSRKWVRRKSFLRASG